MNTPRLVMILASAGAGKTYALTNRFIALLAAGAAPERIVALTFTRKAAGEFFDGILQKLAGAARDAGEAEKLAAQLGRPDLTVGEFGRMLRAVADAMHRLRLGTLDSFFAHVARAFPFELGLAGDFDILQTHAALSERRRVLQLIFARDGELADAQREFLEAFKRATFGAEEKQLTRRLDEFLDEHYETYLEAPAGEKWGNPDRIWPGGQRWRRELQLSPAVAGLRRWLASAAIDDKQRKRWADFLDALEIWSPGAPLPQALEYVIKKALEQWDELEACAAELLFDRKAQKLDAPACRALLDLVCHVAGGEVQRRLETTRGLHAVLRSYDEVYDALVRRAGKLSFADVERMLRPERARPLSRESGEGERLFIDYRLDAEIDHWLLDEFQDTSHGQWTVLRNLIDEVVQDAEKRRTFFAVGDVKQSIFGWRAGDPRLMGEIRAHYNRGADAPIATLPLDESWRSGPAIIAMVNAVFGAGNAIAEMFPGRASAAWNENWRTHTTALQDRNGQAALLHAEDAAERSRVTLELLREIQPLTRGLTCAVLVRRNSEAAAMADYLRREGGIPAVAESDLCVCTDNPLGAALLALFHVAAHPGDSLAWEHVAMTPFGAELDAAGISTAEALAWRVLGQVHADGFERTAGYWLERILTQSAASAAFVRERARQFEAAAALFDATGSRQIDEFVAFMSRHTMRDPESAAVVRVMTIHKAKGLGFDVVVVPELQGNRINEARGGLAVQTNADREVEWVLERPPALIARADAVLEAHWQRAEDDAAYEALSLLYVAMTRAKRAMYVITEPVGTSKSRNFPKLLAEALGDEVRPVRVGNVEFTGAWVAGDPNWHTAVTPPLPPHARAAIPDIKAVPVHRRSARRPSSIPRRGMAAAQLFLELGREQAEFGTEVHRLLAEVEWCDDPDALAAAWRAAGCSSSAVGHVVAALQASGLAEIWRRSVAGDRREVWRERSFEIVLDEDWITGVFDRVMIERDADGRARTATVFDYKTDQLPPGNADALAEAGARHHAQMSIYRRVAASLLGLPIDRVKVELVFTSIPARVPLLED